MDGLANFIILAIVIASVVFRAKRAKEQILKQRAKTGSAAGNFDGQNPAPQPDGADMATNIRNVLLSGGGLSPAFPPQAAAAAFGNKDYNQLMSVYGHGAQLGNDEVSILLKVSPAAADNILQRLELSGQAEKILGSTGRVRYKLI